jgi:hypothetical protein
MRLYVRRNRLLSGVCILCVFCGSARAQNASRGRTVEIAIDFEAARANTVAGDNFWMQGAGLQAAWKLSRHWSAATDVSGLHAGDLPHTTVELNLVTAVFGPRYTDTSAGGRLKLYAQAMGGVARGSNSLFPNPNGATSSATGAALLIGGGQDLRISHHLSVRMLDADWLRTELSNGTTTVQNNLRFGSGIAFLF